MMRILSIVVSVLTLSVLLGSASATAAGQSPSDADIMKRSRRLMVPLELKPAPPGVKHVYADWDHYWAPQPLVSDRFLISRESGSAPNETTTFLSVEQNGRHRSLSVTPRVIRLLSYLSPDGSKLMFSGPVMRNGQYDNGEYILDITTGALAHLRNELFSASSEQVWLKDSRHWIRASHDGPKIRLDRFDYANATPEKTYYIHDSEDYNHWAIYRYGSGILLVEGVGLKRMARIHTDENGPYAEILPANDLGYPILGPDEDTVLYYRETSFRPYGKCLGELAHLPKGWNENNMKWITLYTMRRVGREYTLHEVGCFMDDRRPQAYWQEGTPATTQTIRWTPDGKSICFRCFGWMCTVRAWE